MAYLRFEPHRLAPGRLASIIRQVPHTPLERAVAGAIADLRADPEADPATAPESERLAA
jgi:hypothetical protein